MENTLEDILEEVFQHLSSTELHNARQVCKRWNETISSRPSLQKNMILDIYVNTTMQALQKSKSFPYKSITLTVNEIRISRRINSSLLSEAAEFDANVNEIFTNLGNDLKHLKISHLKRLMPMLLIKTPNLTTLSLSNVDADNLHEHDPEALEEIRQRRDRMRFEFLADPYIHYVIQNIDQYQLEDLRDAELRELVLQGNPHLLFHRHQPINPENLPNILRQYLEELDRDYQYIPHSKSEFLQLYPNIPVLDLQHLKFLKIKSVKKVLFWIEAPNLRTFIVHDALNCDGIGELLMTTGKLENLDMDQFVASKFENYENFTFKLRKLKISCIEDSQLASLDERFVSKFTNFLRSQKDSLKDLTMIFHTVHPEVIRIISFINNYLKLSNFSINFTITSGMLQYLSVLQKFQNIISNCEQVTSLDMHFDMYLETEVLDHLAVSMPNLKSLSLHPFFTKVSSSTVFENLDGLKITKLREGPHTATWYEIAMTCPNIKELTLVDEFFEISPMKLKMVLENAKSLKVLNLTGLFRFVISDEFLKVFMDDNIKVRRLNVHAKMNEEKFCEKMRILTENSNVQTVLHPIF